MVITLILIFNSYYDYSSHTIPDYTHIFIILSAFISIDYSSISLNLLSLILTFSFFLIFEKVNKGKAIFGGGDIKLVCALAFCFKSKIIPIIAFSCLLLFIVHLIKKKKGKEQNCAFAPYILGAYFITLLL